MDARHLTPEQRRSLILSLARHRDYFAALRKRMTACGWYTDDATYQSAVAAYHVIHAMIQTIPKPHVPAQPPPARADVSNCSPFRGPRPNAA